MYTPALFQETDPDRIHDVLRRYPFATVLTSEAGGITGSHLPLLLDPGAGPRGRLRGHLARANRHWQHFDGEREVLAIFHGPHAYVSPSWYRDPQNVPTWNYVVVHVYGTARAYDDPVRLRALLADLVATFEAPMARPWRPPPPGDFIEELLPAIVGFDVDITRVEAKLKLSQNREPADRAGAAAALAAAPDEMGRQVAAWMYALGAPPPEGDRGAG